MEQRNENLGAFDQFNSQLSECCSCQSFQHDPVLLDCLHNHCRLCIESKSRIVHNLKFIVKCTACSEVTELSRITKNSCLFGYQQASALFSESVRCRKCDIEDGAEYWCADCGHGLCASCYTSHNLTTTHHRSDELEVARTWPLRRLTHASNQCSLHKLQLELLCFICSELKCLQCATLCKVLGHDMRPLSHDKALQHFTTVMDTIARTRERIGQVLSALLRRHTGTASRLREVRTSGHRLLVQHRRRLYKSTKNAFDELLGDVCGTFNGIRYDFSQVNAKAVSQRCAENIKALFSYAFQSMQLLSAKRLLRSIALLSSSNRTSFRRLRDSWKESGPMSIHGVVPLTADIFLRACLGATGRTRGLSRVPLLFGQDSVTFRTPVDCCDVDVTQDSHVLLAACYHGLLVYSDRGKLLSSWTPAKQSNGDADWVGCVAVLGDGRAAVGVFYAQLVVLLRRSDSDSTWVEDRRVAVLQSPQWRLAVHFDLLATAGRRQDEQRWVPGCDVTLLRLGSEQPLYTLRRDTDIYGIALTALYLVTTSCRPVKRNRGVAPNVVEAFSHTGELLWQHETSDEEYVGGLCVAASTWSRVFVAVVRRDGRSSKVKALGGTDGRAREVLLSSGTHELRLPGPLSLATGEQRTVMAVLRKVNEYELYAIVSLYNAISVPED